MKSYFYILYLLLLLTLSACSGGPAEKPLPVSITAPARLLDNGVSHYNDNDYAKAIDQFEEALMQYRSIDDQTGIAKSCMNLAMTYMATNNNKTAAEYLGKANVMIKQVPIDELFGHLHLLNSSLAINMGLYEQALQELTPVLLSEDTTTQLAALKNRTRIAFINDADDKPLWLQKYRTLQQANPENTASHLARILRFEAVLSNDENNKTELLTRSLAISRTLADRPAIAATLTQWAQFDFDSGMFDLAEDKYLRALFIRHQLGDVKNSLSILKQLQDTYSVTDKYKEKRAKKWVTKLSSNDLDDWNRLFSDFETYPATGNLK